MEQAIARKKQIKKWNRKWERGLFQKDNPEWIDLWEEVIHQ